MRITPERPVYIHSWGSVVGKKEHEGPLGELFDGWDSTDFFGSGYGMAEKFVGAGGCVVSVKSELGNIV